MIDVTALPEYAECAEVRIKVESAEFNRASRSCAPRKWVDYAGVAAAKWPVLQSLYRHFNEVDRARGSERAREFERWCDRGGDVLRKLALYDAIRALADASRGSVALGLAGVA